MGVQDRDWYRDRHRKANAWYNPKEFRGNKSIQVVAGSRWILLLLAVLGGIAIGVSLSRLKFREQAPAPSRIQPAPIEAVIPKPAPDPRAEEREQREQFRLAEIAERRRREDEALKAAQEAEARRDKAWARFYKPSELCAQHATVECANVYIRARREFEARFASGKY
jgi:hypothetical protein